MKRTGEANWTFERAMEAGDVGINASIVLDASGRPAIACQENSVAVNSQGLAFVIRRDGGWESTSLDSVGVTGFNASMVIDPRGNFHIAYHNYNDLYYARFNGFTWSVNKLTEDATLQDVSSIALDTGGNPCIAFWDNGNLKYMDVSSNHFQGNIVNHYPVTEQEQASADNQEQASSGGGGGCFIATAAFSSYSALVVVRLTSVRDASVMSSRSGASVVGLYYRCSPVIACGMKSGSIKALVRRWLGQK